MYHRTIESSGESREEDASWIVRHLDGELVEHAHANGRDGSPDEGSTRTTERWTPTAVSRTAMQTAVGDDSPQRCDLEPPLLTKPLPLEVGLRWESASACGEGRRRTTEEITGHVVRTERVSIAGIELDTFVIETSSGRGQREQFWFVTDATQWFSPLLGVNVRSTEVHRETELNSAFGSEVTSELVSWPGGPPA